MKSTIKTKLLQQHSKDCTALEQVILGNWSNPWSSYPEDTISRDARCGHRGNTTTWIIFRCNSTGCSGEIAVKADDILDQIPSVS
jgi:hypothetical protein